MSVDPMALAIDWLDAYRNQSLIEILDLYGGSASIECGCDGSSIIVGKGAIAAYWIDRFRAKPASELIDIRPAESGAFVRYRAAERSVSATLYFDQSALILRQACSSEK